MTFKTMEQALNDRNARFERARHINASAAKWIIDFLGKGHTVVEALDECYNLRQVEDVLQAGAFYERSLELRGKYPKTDARYVYECAKSLGTVAAAKLCNVSIRFAEDAYRVGKDFMREEPIASSTQALNHRQFLAHLKDAELIKELKKRGYKGKLTKQQETDI